AMKVFDAHPGKDAQRDARADSSDLQQAAEELPLALRDEAVKHVRILADREVRDEGQRLTDLGEAVERRHGRIDLVADAGHLDRQRRRTLADQRAFQEADHFAPAAARLDRNVREWA